MQRIAILGANGFLGSPIADSFRKQGWEIVAFSRRPHPSSAHPEILVELFDPQSLKAALAESKPDVVISTAWDTEHGKFWINPDNPKYKEATLNFAEISFESGVQSFIGLGTMSEYGISPGVCNPETSPLVPNDIYARSKAETGLELKELGESYDRQTHWLRIFQAFGPNEKPERFIPGLISALRKGEQFAIRTPNFKMDWIHTADIASAVVFSQENRLNHFVNIGTGIATSVRELSDLICTELDLDPSLLDYSAQVPGHEKTVVADPTSQLFSEGWAPSESLQNRIRSLR